VQLKTRTSVDHLTEEPDSYISEQLPEKTKRDELGTKHLFPSKIA